jgi:hypothetical protein
VIRAPFIRLALLALCSLYAFLLALAERVLGLAWMATVVVVSIALALLLALDLDSTAAPRRRTTRVK